LHHTNFDGCFQYRNDNFIVSGDRNLTGGGKCGIYGGAKKIFEEDNMFMMSVNAGILRNRGIGSIIGMIGMIISIRLLGRIWNIEGIRSGECPL
jgi:hypothetical protein